MKSQRSEGFTLIELIVTVGIVLLLSATSLVTYLGYREKRVVQDDANTVAERLRTVQTKATAVEIPAGCIAVAKYVVSVSGTNLTVLASCKEGGNVALPSLALSLSNSTFSAPASVTFDSRTVSASTATINLCGFHNLFRIDINAAANVAKPVYAGSC